LYICPSCAFTFDASIVQISAPKPVPARSLVKVKIPFAIALLAAAVVPSVARADTVDLRVGVEAPLWTHDKNRATSQSYSIGDTLQPALNVLLGFKTNPLLAFDLEFREGFASTGGTNFSRTGTAIGPGLRLQPTGFPVYVRASVPIHVEPSPVTVGLRGAAGLEFSLVVVSLYLEGAVDTTLAGGSVANLSGTSTSTSNVGFGDLTTISGGAGLWFKF
jgi:hypothetical protein